MSNLGPPPDLPKDAEWVGGLYGYRFPRMSVTVDLIVVAEPPDGPPMILLVERANEPCKGRLAFPGGFLNLDETAEQGALREFQEECGGQLPADCKPVLFRVADAVDRDPRGRTISFVHAATYEGEPFAVAGSDDAATAAWYPLAEILRSGGLAFDHGRILMLFALSRNR